MGGLVLRQWLADLARKGCDENGKISPVRIGNILFVGTPLMGAPKAFHAYFNGYSFIFEGSHYLAQLEKYLLGPLNKVGTTFESTYSLLPVWSSLFCRSKLPFLKERTPSVIIEKPHKHVNIFDPIHWDNLRLWRNVNNNIFNEKKINKKKFVTKNLKKAELEGCLGLVKNPHDLKNITSIKYIYGRGEKKDTVAQLKIVATPNKKSKITINKKDWGDGTVPWESAKGYPETFNKEMVEVPETHVKLISHPRVLRIVKSWYKEWEHAPNFLQEPPLRKKGSLQHLSPTYVKAENNSQPHRNKIHQNRLLLIPLDIDKWKGDQFENIAKQNIKYNSKPLQFKRKKSELKDVIIAISRFGSDKGKLKSELVALMMTSEYLYKIGEYSLAHKAASRAISLLNKNNKIEDKFFKTFITAIHAWSSLRLGLIAEAESSFEALHESESDIKKRIAFDGIRAVASVRARKSYVESYRWLEKLRSNSQSEDLLISRNSREQIREIQKSLTLLGYYSGEITGIQNNKTKEAIALYKKSKKIPDREIFSENHHYALHQEAEDIKIQRKFDIAVIIGNRRYQKGIPDVAYAYRDADGVKAVLINDLGFDEGNIIDLRDAGQGAMRNVFGSEKSHQGRLWSYSDPDGKSNIFIYYSGHGAPETKSRKAYLVPVDADPNSLDISGYPLSLVYENLKKIPAKSVTIMLDACFSGDSADGMLIKNASPLVVTTLPEVSSDNFVILSASTGNQLASWDASKGHGIFTANIIKGLKGSADSDGDKKITSGELYDYIFKRVRKTARRRHRREQTPTFYGNENLILNNSIRRYPKKDQQNDIDDLQQQTKGLDDKTKNGDTLSQKGKSDKTKSDTSLGKGIGIGVGIGLGLGLADRLREKRLEELRKQKKD